MRERIVVFVAIVNVCSRGEKREKELFFIELYDFFKYKNSFGVATMFSRLRELL